MKQNTKTSIDRDWPGDDRRAFDECNIYNVINFGLKMQLLTDEECRAFEWLMTSWSEDPHPRNFGLLVRQGLCYADVIRPHFQRIVALLFDSHADVAAACKAFMRYELRNSALTPADETFSSARV